MPQYLDDSGNPIPAKQYLDDSGNPISAQTAAPAPRARPEARTLGNYASEITRGAGRGVKNDVTGIYQTLRHPIDTATGLVKQGTQAVKDATQEYRDNAAAPAPQRIAATALKGLEEAPVIGGMVQHAEQGGTEMASPEAAGAAAEGIASFAAPEVAGRAIALAPRAVRAVTGTTPRAMRDLVKDTRTENAAAVDKAAAGTAKDRAAVDKTNAKLETDRAAEVKAHGAKVSAAKDVAEQRAGVASRKAALESGVKKLSDKFQGDLKATRDKAHAEADAKYTTLNKALGEKTIESKALLGHLIDASEKFKGSNTEPAIFKDIQKAVEGSDTIPYDDLQGYYSELGKELSKGTLQGDVYTAYNTLQEAIGGEMQKIADANGMGPQLADARTSWRNLKQTFYDPKSPLRKALDAKEPGAAAKMLVGKDRTAIEALAKYNPELAQRGNVLRGYHEEAAATKPSTAAPKPEPQLAPRKAPEQYPEPQAAPVKKIGQQEVQDAKAEALQKRTDLVRHKALWIAAGPPIYALVDMLRGHSPNIGEVAGVSAGIGALSAGIGRLMENQKVVDFLTKATPADVAAIPEDLRGDFPRLVQEAQKRGIKVSPYLVRGAQGAALAPRRFDVETGTQPANELMPGASDPSSLPAPLQRELESAQIVRGKPTATYGKPDIATYEPGSSQIVVRDPARFQPEVLSHELTHKWQASLPAPLRARMPADDPRNPYMKPEDLYGLKDMWKAGKRFIDLPPEKQAQVNQAWSKYQGDPEMRKILKPWVDDMNSYPQGVVMPTDPDQKGINTTLRPPSAPDYAFQPAPRAQHPTDAWQGIER